MTRHTKLVKKEVLYDIFPPADHEAASRYNQPRGIPMRAVQMPDLSFTLVAAGEDQVARYDAAPTFSDYLDGEELLGTAPGDLKGQL